MAAAVAVVCGCGGSSSPAVIAGSPFTRNLPVHAQYADFARAVNLRPQDVEGFTGGPSKRRRNHSRGESGRFGRCVGIRRPAKPLLKAGSDDFTSRGRLEYESISSDVEIVPSVASAHAELTVISKALATPAARRCLIGAFGGLGALHGTRTVRGVLVRTQVSDVRLVPLQLGAAVAGTDGGTGLSLNAKVTYVAIGRERVVTVPSALHLDVLAFQLRRAEITLATIAVGAPLSADLETHLLSLLVSRALSASQAYPAVRR